MASTEERDSNRTSRSERFARVVATATTAPSKFSLMARDLKTTAAGVVDNASGQWALRLDNAHPGVNTPHININSGLTGVPDPHIPVSSGVLTAGKTATKVIQYAGKAALVAGIANDSYRIAGAIVDDCKNTKKKRPGKKTAKVASSVGGGWAGGIAGGWCGNSTGAAVGGTVGALFGGVGAVPGAIVGSVIGGVSGAFGGSISGSKIAQTMVEKYVPDDDDEEDDGPRSSRIFANKDGLELSSRSGGKPNGLIRSNL